MIFADIPPGAAVFLDANTFVYHFGPEPVLGPPCRDLLDRILQREIAGYTSSQVLSNVAHRLMTIEAMNTYGWPAARIAYRLQRSPGEVQGLAAFRRCVEEVPRLGIQVLSVELSHVLTAAALSQQHGLLSGDALVLAVMQAHGFSDLASHDADFDRVPGITRYTPA